MPIPVESPCFGCVDRAGKRAACCWDSRLVVNEGEYLKLFVKAYMNGKIEVTELYPREDEGMRFLVQLIGACIYLNKESGECGLHDTGAKPKSCLAAEPGRFGFCDRNVRLKQ